MFFNAILLLFSAFCIFAILVAALSYRERLNKISNIMVFLEIGKLDAAENYIKNNRDEIFSKDSESFLKSIEVIKSKIK